MELSVIIAIVGVLVALTNVIVEVVKKSTWDKLPTNVLALIVAEALTLAAGFAYFQIKALPIAWYVVAAFVVEMCIRDRSWVFWYTWPFSVAHSSSS